MAFGRWDVGDGRDVLRVSSPSPAIETKVGKLGENVLPASVLKRESTHRVGRFFLQQRDALCLCCFPQIAIEGRQRQSIAVGKLQIRRVVNREPMRFA